ncbi:MAG: hypothetical protein ACI9JN_001284 [Bacteroidia bacterium]|jgi:hypothetical protein
MTLKKEFFEGLNPFKTDIEYEFNATLLIGKTKVKVESNNRQEIMDILSSWLFDNKMDYKEFEVVEGSSKWQKDDAEVTCNFVDHEA